MTRVIEVDGTDVTALTRADSWALQMKAHAGEVAAGSIVFDDTTGTADPAAAMKVWVVTESAATPTTIAGGFISERRPERGPLTVAQQRQWEPVLEDYNAALMDRVLKGTNARRPVETDVARIQWLVDTGALGMLDGSDISATDPESLEKTNYRGKYPFDVLNDAAENTGKNFFVYFKAGTGWVLFYGPWNQTGAAFTSTLRISDVSTDIDNSVTFGASDISYELDPGRIYSHLFIKWRKGWVTVTDSGTESSYRNRQKTIVRENFKSAARARTWGEKQLTKLDEEVKKLTLSLDVPASALGELRALQRIQVKLTHVGITAFTYFRIIDATYRWKTDDRYGVTLVMRDKIRPVNIGDIHGDPETTTASKGSGSGGVGNEDVGEDDDPADLTEYAFEDWIEVVAPAAANVVDIGDIPDSDGIWWTAPLPWVSAPGNPATVTVEVDGSKLITTHPSATNQVVNFFIDDENLPSEGSWLFDVELDVMDATGNAASVTLWLLDPATNDFTEVILAFETGNSFITIDYTQQDPLVQDTASAVVTLAAATRYSVRWEVTDDTFRARVWAASASEPTTWDVTLAHAMAVPAGEVNLKVAAGDGAAQEFFVYPIYVTRVPRLGQRIERALLALGDGVTTTFTLPYSWLPGSLSIWVSGVNVTPASEDPVAGTVTFDAYPGNGASITYSLTVA